MLRVTERIFLVYKAPHFVWRALLQYILTAAIAGTVYGVCAYMREREKEREREREKERERERRQQALLQRHSLLHGTFWSRGPVSALRVI
jgi:hypothetical protein